MRLGQQGGGPDRTRQTAAEIGGPRAHLLPVGGGKGGVGKTFLAANLAACLARAGRRVVAVDADLEGANLHTALGVRRPRHSIAEYVAGREEDVEQLLEPTPVDNLRLLAATGPDLGETQPSPERRVGFIRKLRDIDADFVILDLGAGTASDVMDYFMVCDDGIVVVAPEPTSVENAYGFMRAAFYRRLRLAMVSPGVRQLVRSAMDQQDERRIRTPVDLLREVARLDPEEGRRFAAVMRSFRPSLVINDARSAEDIRLGFAVRSICRKYYAIEVDYIGYVSHDEAAREAVRSCRPIIESHPESSATVYLTRIARKIEGRIAGADA